MTALGALCALCGAGNATYAGQRCFRCWLDPDRPVAIDLDDSIFDEDDVNPLAPGRSVSLRDISAQPIPDEPGTAPHAPTRPDWLKGWPMDPLAAPAEKLPTIPGFPFLHPGLCALISGPTGKGRSSLVQACAYDAAQHGVRVAYLGSEVTYDEFNARTVDLAQRRGDPLTSELRDQLANVTYLELASTMVRAGDDPGLWLAGVRDHFDVVLIDPLSAVASALMLDFDTSNSDYVKFYDRLIQPLVTERVAVILLENIGHSDEAKRRAKGASAKGDKADLTFSCAAPKGSLVIRADKLRTVRAAFTAGDEWTFRREDQRIERHAPGNTGDTWKPTRLMERLSEAIAAEPGMTKRAVRSSVKGNSEHLDVALEHLITDGYVEARKERHGRAWAECHYPLRPFTDA